MKSLTPEQIEIADLKSRIAVLEAILGVSNDRSTFLPLSQAGRILHQSPRTLYNKVVKAKSFPKDSPFKEGVHWKEKKAGTSRQYYIDPVMWEKAVQP